MASIGRTHHLKCIEPGCGKRRPYWSDRCKQHRNAALRPRDYCDYCGADAANDGHHATCPTQEVE